MQCEPVSVSRMLIFLQVGASAMTSGLLQPLGGDHSLVLAAAQLLAQKASLVEARAQVFAA